MFTISKEDEATLIKAHILILDELIDLVLESPFKPLSPVEEIAKKHDVTVTIEKLRRQKPVSEAELDVLLLDPSLQSLQNFRKTVGRVACLEPRSKTVTPCFVTSREQLDSRLSQKQTRAGLAISMVPAPEKV